jgi:hypothetical protein
VRFELKSSAACGITRARAFNVNRCARGIHHQDPPCQINAAHNTDAPTPSRHAGFNMADAGATFVAKREQVAKSGRLWYHACARI